MSGKPGPPHLAVQRHPTTPPPPGRPPGLLPPPAHAPNLPLHAPASAPGPGPGPPAPAPEPAGLRSAHPPVLGLSVPFRAAVQAPASRSGTPPGTVAFDDGTPALGTGTLDGSGIA